MGRKDFVHMTSSQRYSGQRSSDGWHFSFVEQRNLRKIMIIRFQSEASWDREFAEVTMWKETQQEDVSENIDEWKWQNDL